jgi:hypothetical protein
MMLVPLAVLVLCARRMSNGRDRSLDVVIVVLQADEITARQDELRHEETGDEAGDAAIAHAWSLSGAPPAEEVADCHQA